jgi:hypothetical protein
MSDGAAPTLDLSAWLTKAEAGRRLGVSERTLDRMKFRGGPERRNRQAPGRRPEVVYNPVDIERLTQPAPTVIEQPHLPPQQLATRPQSGPGWDALAANFSTLARLFPATAGKLFLTVPEASLYSGLSEAFLNLAIETGVLPAVSDGEWKVRRADLDTFAADDYIADNLSQLSTPKKGRITDGKTGRKGQE